jgi:hypothetical protein
MQASLEYLFLKKKHGDEGNIHHLNHDSPLDFL